MGQIPACKDTACEMALVVSEAAWACGGCRGWSMQKGLLNHSLTWIHILGYHEEIAPNFY